MPRKLTKEEFVKRAKEKHDDKYDYTKSEYIDSRTKVVIICPQHGEFEQIPDTHIRGGRCWKCGVEKRSLTNLMSNEQFIEKAKNIHGDIYDYSKVIYRGVKKKIIIICPIHGEFKTRPDIHLGKFICYKCRNESIGNRLRSSKEDFLIKTKQIHGDKYDYRKFIYINNTVKGIITCFKHGDFKQSPNAHLSGVGCPICNSSKGELEIKSILDKHGIRNQQQFMIPNQIYKFRYDLYLPDYNLLIEYHGKQHYEYIPYFHRDEDRFLLQKERDLFKKVLAKELNYRFIEFNYKQFKYMTKEEFTSLILTTIYKTKRA